MRNFLILTFVLVSHFSIGQYKGDSWADVKSKGAGTLSVVYYEQPGLIFKADDGKFKGVCVDILSDFQKHVEKKYGKRINIQYVGEETDFSNFLKVVQTTPNILGVTNTSITEERKKIMKFTPPYMTTMLVMLTNRNAPVLKYLKDLPVTFKDFSAEVISGSTHVKYVEQMKKDYFPSLKVTYTSSSESVIKNLSTDTKLFSILDFIDYIGIVRKKLPVKRQEVELGNPESLGFIMAKQSDWDVLFNEFLTEEYRKSVRFKEIVAENLGSSFLSLVR
jgi:ABC-type amino acid transport substrate-binding protein